MSAYYSTTNGQYLFRLMADEKPTGYSGPYVVIDPEDREQVERLTKVLVEAAFSHGNVIVSDNGIHPDTTEAALREFAAPTPPKPDEPQGLGAVVEDADGKRWVRVGVTIGDLHWRSSEPGNTNCFKWRAINAVRILSEGVTA